MQKSVAARSLLFSPGGPLAKELSRHGVVLRVNDWLFAHGGILPHHGEGCYFMCASIFYCVWQTCLVSCVVTLESLGSLFLYCIELLFHAIEKLKLQLFAVEYGLERINKEVSDWMLGARNSLGQQLPIPFIATRGFDSVVWSRLYSRETSEKSEESIRVSQGAFIYILKCQCYTSFLLMRKVCKLHGFWL